MKPYPEWTNDELWQQEQLNFAAHMAVIFTYLPKHGLSIDDFIRYTGEEVISGWMEEVETAAEMMNATLVNVRANGGEILEASLMINLAPAPESLSCSTSSLWRVFTALLI